MRSAFHNIRFIAAVIGGGIIMLALFSLMHGMIGGNPIGGTLASRIKLVHFVHVNMQQPAKPKQRLQPPPPPPRKPPPQTQMKTQANRKVPIQHLPVQIQMGALNGGNLYINPNAGPATNAGGYAPLTPMVRFRPLYPPQAQIQGVTGTVKTCFTVEPDGTVSNPYVTHATSPAARRMLSQAALQTIRKWKFFPRKVNGKPVATSNVCQDIVFKI